MQRNNPLEPVPGRPGMHTQPSEIPPEKAQEMLRCFLNPDLACGPSCMAFLTTVPPEGDYKGQPWAHCHILLNMHRGGKHLVIIASTLDKLSKSMTKAPDPAVEHANIPPPRVT